MSQSNFLCLSIIILSKIPPFNWRDLINDLDLYNLSCKVSTFYFSKFWFLRGLLVEKRFSFLVWCPMKKFLPFVILIRICSTNIKQLLLPSKSFYILCMENIKGTIELSDKKIILKPYGGVKETWIRQLNPEFEVGLIFIKHKGEYFFKK